MGCAGSDDPPSGASDHGGNEAARSDDLPIGASDYGGLEPV